MQSVGAAAWPVQLHLAARHPGRSGGSSGGGRHACWQQQQQQQHAACSTLQQHLAAGTAA
jgi:hypothetical protein